MPDLIRKAVAALRKYQKQNLTEDVQYIVPGAGSAGDLVINLLMTVGGEESKQNDVGIFIDSRSQDFLCDPNDLVDPDGVFNGGNVFSPNRGHQIVRSMIDIDDEPTQDITYTVMSGDGEPPQRQSSRYHLNLRIHTKRVAFEIKTVP